MSKRMVALRKKMILLSLGGAALAFPFFLDGGDFGCVRNDNLVGFYQTVGDQSIAEFTDTTRDTLPAPFNSDDFNNIVITPVETFFTAMWDNWVAQQHPLDLDVSGVVRQ